MNPAKLKDIILNTSHPLVLCNVHPQWNCFQQTFNEWCESFDNVHKDYVQFDGCSVMGGDSPQWEWQRTKVDEDITFWIGSKQAHTPCHYDTYGCNIVVQVFGRKSWTLLPPEAKLTPVRIPYEESSVYCEENFYSPASYRPFTKVENDVYHIVLEPGMVLIVPPRWWHYVETLEPALNFNTWLSLETDVDSLISECITKMMVQDLCHGVADNMKRRIINPNEELLATTTNVNMSYDILNYLLNQKRTNKQQRTDLKRYPCNYLPSEALSRLIAESDSYLRPVQKLHQSDFYNFIACNHVRYNSSNDGLHYAGLTPEETEKAVRLRNLINVCCKSDIIKSIEKALLDEYSD
ncbi:HSPB1-associated protein 1 isoform X2 [Anopheles stephensi]|uniref:HSPB1-associated protein 1 isoform X2 n=1 Tax=Anopheles stephensi TaxID=30069 RepID=UPI001658867F|nr:HSPB1-associated protein 1 isoform X2 [Anopheles stephensi]